MSAFAPMVSQFWLPPSHAIREVAAVRKAVNEYDRNLDFGQNERTGQWCVFLKHGSMEAATEGDLPVLGFDDIPSPDYVVKRLYQADAVRRGHEILDDIERHNESIHEVGREKTRHAEGMLAEAFEWGMRQEGMTPHKKIYIP